ncbi:MAG: hypothetical protein AAFX06_29645 [Planctomycetota bacterium]
MSDSPCDKWQAAVDRDRNEAMPPELSEHIAECAECQAMLAIETEWETALRDHAESLTEFAWNADSVGAPVVSSTVSSPSIRGGRWLALAITLAATVLAIASLNWGIEAVPSRESPLIAARSDPGGVATVDADEPEKQPAEPAIPEPTESETRRPPTLVHTVSSASHLSVADSSRPDDGLTFIMLYPRSTKADASNE